MRLFHGEEVDDGHFAVVVNISRKIYDRVTVAIRTVMQAEAAISSVGRRAKCSFFIMSPALKIIKRLL